MEKEKKENMRDSFLNADHALLQARSLALIGEDINEANNEDQENNFNLFSIIKEKIKVAQSFFDDYESFWMKEKE